MHLLQARVKDRLFIQAVEYVCARLQNIIAPNHAHTPTVKHTFMTSIEKI